MSKRYYLWLGALAVVALTGLQANDANAATAHTSVIRQDCSTFSGSEPCFTSLAAWETAFGNINFNGAAAGDLVAADIQENVRIEGFWTADDITQTVIDGWNTNESHFINIFTVGQSRAGAQWQDTGAYTLNVAVHAQFAISIVEPYTRVTGLQIDTRARAGASAVNMQANFVKLESNHIRGGGRSGIGGGVFFTGRFGAVNNNVIRDYYHCIAAGSSLNRGEIRNIFNNSLYSCGTGITGRGANAGSVSIKNNIVYASTTAFSNPTPAFFSNNASEATGMVGTDNIVLVASPFADAMAGNMALPENSPLIDKGVNLSADIYHPFNADIERDIRTGPWDIGADEYITGDNQAPSQPGTLTAQSVSATQINIAWAASTDNVEVIAYRVYRNGSLAATVNAPATTFTNTGLNPASSYTYHVTAVDGANNESSPSGSASATTAASKANIINHLNLNRGGIPQNYLDLVREKDIFFAHQSVGGNLVDALAALSATENSRYGLNITSTPAGIWFDTNNALAHTRSLGSNGYPELKISEFDRFLRQDGYVEHLDIALMKFCYADFYVNWTGQQIWELYQPMLAKLQQDYPNVTFVWTTAPLMTGNSVNQSTFNNLLREYVHNNGGYILDIADIESHDPNGNLTTHTGQPALYSGYTIDGGHLVPEAADRVASAWWYLMAKLSGWNGDNQESPDVVAPEVTVTAPTPGQTLPAGTRQTNLSVSTNENAVCRWNNTNDFETTGSMVHSTLISGLADGQNYTVYVSCTDQANNASGSHAVSFSVAEPASIPAPTLSLTANPTSINWGGSSTISWNSTGADSCQASGGWSGTRTTSGSQTMTGLSATATYTLTCSGQGGSTSESVTVAVSAAPEPTVDNQAPSVAITSHQNGQIVSGVITITAEASDNVRVARVSFYYNGTLLYTDSTAPYSTSADSRVVPNGNYTLTARAYDEAGNSTLSAPVQIIVQN